MTTRWAWLAAMAIACGGCGRTPQTAPAGGPPQAPPARSPAESLLRDENWRWVESQRLRLEFPLPDRSSWSVDDRSTSWLVATHPTSESRIVVKTWRADSVVNRDDCERMARRSRPLPSDGDADASKRFANRPEGYDTAVTLTVGVGSTGDTLNGALLAFGANVRQCLALVFVTQAAGRGADRILGERLGLIDRGVVDRLRRRSVEDRARSARTGH